MKIRNTAIPAAYIYLERDGKILLARRLNTGYQDGNYQFPAGHVEDGELPSEAIIREAQEEIGITLAPDDLELVHVSYRPKHDNTDNRVDFFFRALRWSGDVTNMEPHKCDDLLWAAPNALPPNVVPHVREALICIEQGIFFRELDFDFLKRNGLI